MFRFQHFPIKWQLVFTNMFIAVSTLLVSLLILYSYNHEAMQKRIVKELELLAEPIGLNNTATIRFHNKTDALSSLGVLRSNDNIEVASLLYPDTSVFVEYFKHDSIVSYLVPKITRSGKLKQDDKIEVYQAIVIDDIVFGFIYIRSNLDDLEILRNYNFKIAGIAIIASSLFALIVALYFSRPISVPVRRLSQLAREIGENNDFSTRIKELHGSNEVSQLYKAFNEMLSQIEEQNIELQTAFDFVQMQKDEIRQQNLDITDSISAARRLQGIILPQMSDINRIVPEAFVFFKPKDIVSGDFYWFARRGTWCFFAAVDCVGHGIPGALLSIVADNWLQKIIVESKLTDPGEILNHLDKAVTRSLKNETGSTRSMDIALLAINFHTHELRFAGAYNPLYIVRDGKLQEFKADRIAIGSLKDYRQSSFTSHRFKLQQDDMLYLFSDGFADQFGGKNNKKYKYKPFRELLSQISHLSPEEQEYQLETTFQKWRGDNEQVDDIIVLGIKTPERITELLPFKHR